MKIAETKTTSSSLQKNGKPFFEKGSGQVFFSDHAVDTFFTKSQNSRSVIQPKLTVGQPDDKYEKEADAVADKVVQRLAMPGDLKEKETGVQTKPLGAGITPLIQTKCDGCEQEEKLQTKDEEDLVQESPLELQLKTIFESNAEPPDDRSDIQRKCAECEREDKIQKKPDSQDPQTASSNIESSISSSKGSGATIPVHTKEQMEVSFGADFSNVRIHTDSSAVQMSKDLNAQAFTHGSDIYFNSGKYDTNTVGGTSLLAHELTHTIQQNGQVQMKRQDPDCILIPQTPLTSLWRNSQTHNLVQGKREPETDSVQDKMSWVDSVDVANSTPPPDEQNNSRQLSVKPLNPLARYIQRQPLPTTDPKQADTVVKMIVDKDVELYYWNKVDQIGISLYQAPWIQVRWSAGHGNSMPDIKITSDSFPKKYKVEIKAPYDILVTIDGQVESRYSSLFVGGASFHHKYIARGKKVIVNKHLVGGQVVDTPDFSKDLPEIIEINNGYEGHVTDIKSLDRELNPELPARNAPGPMKNFQFDPDFFWLFDTLDQLQAFVAAWPNWNWIERPAAGQKFMAVALDETAMQQYAHETRQNAAPDFTRIYVEGKKLDPWLIYDLFYTADWDAKDGSPGDSADCLVYRHANNSFGREALDHGIAMMYWTMLDNTSVADVEQKKINEHPFVELCVTGSSGTPWEIDLDYVKARDQLFIAVYKKRADDEGSLNPFADSSGWDSVLTDDLWRRYLSPAVDRPESYIDDSLRQLLDQNSGLVTAGGERILKSVEFDAKLEGEFAIKGAIDGLLIYATEDSAKRLVQKIPYMTSHEQDDTLEFIGVIPTLRPLWKVVLSSPTNSALIWMGESILGVSTKSIQERIREQIKDLREFESSIRSDEISPLFMEGDFGNRIREKVYKRFGFNLKPENFPHEDDAKWRGANKGWTGHYGSESAYLFAHAAAADARRKRYAKYFKIFLLVVASVVLVLVANAAGAALAGLIFSTATTAGLIGFTVVELSIAAGIVTLVGPGMQTFILSGGTASAEDYSEAYKNLGTKFVVNFVTFGFFKALSAATRAIAVSGAGGKQAFAASRAWKNADLGLRVTTSAGAFLGIAVLSKYIETGKVPEGKEMNELLFETALSVILLEVGAYATRGPMESLSKWTKQQRLGAFGPEMEKLLVDAHAINYRIAEYSTRPNAAPEEGPKLLELQKELLIKQRDLVARMSKSFRTRPDAKQLEAELNRIESDYSILIQELTDAGFFAKAKIRPSGRLGNEDASFTYKRGQEEEIRKYYGDENVKDVGNGVLEVVSGDQKLTFSPSAELDPTLQPDGTRRADSKEAWRSSLAERQLKVIEAAYKLAESSKELKAVEKADPSKMTDKELARFEAKLKLVEAKIEKLSATNKAAYDKADPVAGESTEMWRLRLVSLRENLIQRAQLLGQEQLVAAIKKLPTSRPNLVRDTLVKHAELLEKARQNIEKSWNEKFEAAKTSQALQPPKDIAVLRARLVERQAALRLRIRFHGSAEAKYMKEALKNIGSMEKLSSLRELESRIEAAEKNFDIKSFKALEAGINKFGKETVDAARTGELAGLSDVQVGDVLKMLQNANSLTVSALKGALYASMPPPKGSTAASHIPLENAVRFSRSPAELNFVLESFLALRQAGIKGTYQLLRDATSSGNNWKGSLWQLQVVRIVIGTGRVAALEVKVPGREIDILLTDGTRIETKDWLTWDPSKVHEQFAVDLEGATLGGKNPNGLKGIVWMFKSPAPISAAKIRGVMESALDNFISAKLKDGTLSTAQAKLLKQAFNDHLDLVQVPKIDGTQGMADLPGVSQPTLLPPINKRDDEP